MQKPCVFNFFFARLSLNNAKTPSFQVFFEKMLALFKYNRANDTMFLAVLSKLCKPETASIQFFFHFWHGFGQKKGNWRRKSLECKDMKAQATKWKEIRPQKATLKGQKDKKKGNRGHKRIKWKERKPQKNKMKNIKVQEDKMRRSGQKQMKPQRPKGKEMKPLKAKTARMKPQRATWKGQWREWSLARRKGRKQRTENVEKERPKTKGNEATKGRKKCIFKSEVPRKLQMRWRRRKCQDFSGRKRSPSWGPAKSSRGVICSQPLTQKNRKIQNRYPL